MFMGYKLSPSTLNLLEDCPKCFWLQIVKKIPRPSGAFPSLPSGVDKILKEHFDSFMKKGKLPPELKHTNGYKLFDNEELLKIWRSNFKGIEHLDDKSGIPVGTDKSERCTLIFSESTKNEEIMGELNEIGLSKARKNL